MPQTPDVRSKISSIDERAARLRAQKSRLVARANQTERKRDTRRKILIGGAVLAAVEHEGVPAIRTREELVRWMNDRLTRSHDREVFDFATPAENR